MSRQGVKFWAAFVAAIVSATGCHPQQPLFLCEDGDLSHYLEVATDLEVPDVDQPPIEEVVASRPPLTLENLDSYERWYITLEECTHYALANSQVIRSIGGRTIANIPNVPETLTRELVGAGVTSTVYDPALTESANGISSGSRFNGTGVEAALSEFDAQFTTSIFWEKNDQPRNTDTPTIQARILDQDLARFNAGVSKTTAAGGTVSFRNNTVYDQNNNPLRAFTSDWNTNFEAAFSQPLLQGAGVQYNRIAGPFSSDQFNGGFGNSPDGVVIARIRTDLALADFEGRIINMLADLEFAYLDLYFAYRDLNAKKAGRDSALESWKKVQALSLVGARGGEAEKLAQARAQYFFFRSEVETSLTNLLAAETRLRYLMGLSVSDGRLICPGDEPTTAKVTFDWGLVHPEALCRRVEVRKQKWSVKRREMEVIAAKNHLLPRFDAVGRYRWMGLGDDLLSSNRSGLGPTDPGSNAAEILTGGDFQEWQLGLTLSVPIGFRQALSGVRHSQLAVARERALLEDVELEISHQLGDAIRTLVSQYQLSQTNLNRRAAAELEVKAVRAAYEEREVTLDLLLDAQRRLADAEIAYYRSVVDYNRAIMNVHLRKGSLLEQNNVQLAEGPWPAKAYFDALREARRRDASTYLDYGFTRPEVFSQGPYPQHVGADPGLQGEPIPAGVPAPGSMQPEEIPTPEPGTDADDEPETLPEPDRDRTARGPLLRSAGVSPRESAPDQPAVDGILKQAIRPAGKEGLEWRPTGRNSIAVNRVETRPSAVSTVAAARPLAEARTPSSTSPKEVHAPATIDRTRADRRPVSQRLRR